MINRKRHSNPAASKEFAPNLSWLSINEFGDQNP